MSNLSEEEIIYTLKQVIDTCTKWEEMPYGFNEHIIQAIQGLLDLYNKEKQLNYEIKNLLESTPKELLDKAVAINNTIGFIKDNFVEKDKIKDKIKELEEQCKTELLTTWLEAKIEVLEELLEGE